MASYLLVISPTPSTHHGLDGKVEYLDPDGILRRSEKVTRRMIQRGIPINNALAISLDDQAHTSLAERIQDTQERKAAVLKANQAASQKEEGSVTLKQLEKQRKTQWLKDANELIHTRVKIWHDQQYLASHELAKIDITEQNRPFSPSKTNTYIDDDGNLRRKRSEQAKTMLPPELPLENATENYMPVVTP